MRMRALLGSLALTLLLLLGVCFRQACVTGEFALAYSHNHVHIM